MTDKKPWEKEKKKSKFIICPKCRTQSLLAICSFCGKNLRKINVKTTTKIQGEN